MDVTEDAVRDICTDAVFDRGERYLAEGRIREIHRVDTTVTAVVSGSRQYDVRVDLATDGFAPWCDCPYDGPGACKHVVAVLLRCVDDPPPDEGDRLDAELDGTDADELRAFLRDELATDADLRDRFLARIGEPTRQSVDEFRTSIDRRFEETNPEYHVVFEPIDFTQWFDIANEYHEQGRYASAATVYRALTESLDENMERVDGAYDHFSRAFSRALDGYVDCVAATEHDADAVTDAVSFLTERATSGTPFLAEHFEKAAVELQESRETRGYEEAVLACFDTATTWNLHVDEKLRRDLPDGSARVKVFGAPGAYEVDWWSPKPDEDWIPVERGEFDDVEEPADVSHLA